MHTSFRLNTGDQRQPDALQHVRDHNGWDDVHRAGNLERAKRSCDPPWGEKQQRVLACLVNAVRTYLLGKCESVE
jgi:hypothetical protein